MRLRFTTETDPTWNDANSCVFTVTANDDQCRTYSIDLSGLAGWKSQLRQLRLDMATGKPLSGTCRIDYIWIGTAAATVQ